MRKYIVDLTNNLIGKNRYDEVFYLIGDTEAFIRHVKVDLESGDVHVMSPEKLGMIMCSFEIGDVMVDSNRFLGGIRFGGDCAEMLRELVSLCLAYAIRDRLDERCLTGTPPWRGRNPGLQTGFRKAFGQHVARQWSRDAR